MIGKGTFGTVYRQRVGETVVAAKVYQNIVDFKRELSNIDAINAAPKRKMVDRGSSNVLEMLHSDSDKLTIYFPLMETDLDKIIRARKANLLMCIRILLDFLIGVQYLHELGFLHLDLKPSNILVHHGRAKIADFGTTRKLNDPNKPTNKTTQCYRAPKLYFLAKNFDEKVDVWSLGCIVYEMCTYERLLSAARTDDAYYIAQLVEKFGKPTNATWPNVESLPGYQQCADRWQKECNKKGSFEFDIPHY